MNIEEITGTVYMPIHSGKPEQIPKKKFDTVLSQAIEKKERIKADFDNLKTRQSIRLDNIYGDGAFKPK